MDFNSRMLCTCILRILDHMLCMETTSQVLVVRHSMVSVDPSRSRGGNYNFVTTYRLFFYVIHMSNILFQVVSEWQTQTCIGVWKRKTESHLIHWLCTSLVVNCTFNCMNLFGTLNIVLHSQTNYNSEIKDRLLVLCQGAVAKHRKSYPEMWGRFFKSRWWTS